jgi:hypothetical protein
MNTETKTFTLKGQRGRAKGPSPAPKPSSIAEFVTTALTNPLTPPPYPVTPRTRKRACVRSGIWETLKTPEERSQYAKWMASRRKPENMARPNKGGARRTPNGWTHDAAQAAIARAELEASRLLKKLLANGTIAKGDKETAEATKAALVLLRSPGGKQSEKDSVATRLLSVFHPETQEASR